MATITVSPVTKFSHSSWLSPGGGLGPLAALCAMGAGGLAVLSLAASWWWGLDLFSPFQFQYAAVLALAVTGFAIRKRWFWMGLAAVLLILPATRVTRCLAGGGNDPHAGTASLKVLSFNVLCSNRNHAELREWVRMANPDVAFFAEVGPEWAAVLEGLRPILPYHAVVPREDNFGVAILSKYPLRSTRLITANELPTAAIRVELTVAGREVMVIGAHPPPPLSERLAVERNETLAALAGEARNCQGPMILMGDLNATPWCDGMQPLYAAGLRDARRGLEFGPTWRRLNPLVAIPIDHILTKGAVSVVRCQTGPAQGSDHRPLLADLRL